MTNEDRLKSLKTMDIEEVEPPGMRNIKKIELFKKWRKFIPDEKKDLVCPPVSEEVLGKVVQQMQEAREDRAM